MWYSNQYFRHLCDMHIDDWNPEFLSRFSPENYVDMLVKGRFQTAMLYYQSHVGLNYYPTKAGVIHAAFRGREDLMLRTEQLCHEKGISVMGYYSLIFNNREGERHPDWQMRYIDGRDAVQRGSRFRKCCPNNVEYRAFVFTQIDEILAYFHPEGMFYDMPYWPQYCYCDACRARWEKEYGGEMPEEETDSRFRELKDARMRWMTEFTKAVADHTRAIRSNLALEFNFAYSAKAEEEPGMSEENGRCGDFVGGDIHGSVALQSFTCKYFNAATRNLPYEYMFSRCLPNLLNHTMLKSEARILQSVLLTLCQQGATLYIDAIDPVGTLDERVYRRFGNVAEKCDKYMPHVSGHLVSDIGVVYLQQCKQYPLAKGKNHYGCVLNLAETFTHKHIPYRVVPECRFDRLDDYKVLILPEANHLNKESAGKLISYVENGGMLYMSGAGVSELMEYAGLTFRENGSDKYSYLAPRAETGTFLNEYTPKYPLPVDMALPRVTASMDNEVLATLTLPYQSDVPGRFSSIHSNPPGCGTDFAALTVVSRGKGKILWCVAPIEGYEEYDYRRIFTELMDKYLPTQLCYETDCPEDVELVLLKDEQKKKLRLSCIDVSDLDEYRTLASFTVSVRLEEKIASVIRIDGEKVPFTQKDGRLCFTAHPLTLFDMYEMDFE